MAPRFFAAEFPNDNPDIHTGTTWMSTEPCGPPVAHAAEWWEEATGDDTDEPIEIVESIELEEPIERVPPPLVSAPPETTPEIAALSIAIEDEPPGAPAIGDAEDEDPYAHFIRTLAEVAVASGATMDVATIDAMLESDAIASAWRAILRGESEDFSKCAATLDEWAAGALASILSAPQKAAQLRRELRARGVAAFGLIDSS